MEQIKLTQTQIVSSAGSAASGSWDSPTSAPTDIDERLIADEVLGVRRGHYKGTRQIVKGKEKVSSSSSTFSSGLQSQAEQQHRFKERLDTQQREIDTLKALIAQMTTA